MVTHTLSLCAIRSGANNKLLNQWAVHWALTFPSPNCPTHHHHAHTPTYTNPGLNTQSTSHASSSTGSGLGPFGKQWFWRIIHRHMGSRPQALYPIFSAWKHLETRNSQHYQPEQNTSLSLFALSPEASHTSNHREVVAVIWSVWVCAGL